MTTPPGAIVGYARTSTTDQQAGLDSQIAELQAAGCTRIFSEQVSGADTCRPQLQAALDWVRAGDIFVVTKPERLARNVMDLLGLVERLRAKDVTVRILAMHLDTGNPTSNLILTILAGVGSWEREIMLERQRAGIAKAKADGKYKGRAPTARAKASEVLRLKAEGYTVAEMAEAVGISRASVYRLLADGGARR
ncbi:recombinase family protein [Brevundimonas intermedia]|uniref:Recombinase family protein n=1 Tax=Brevundimonas intermedia TaxID=74315 RepID=A0A4Y9RSF8_9CAUL|nr:recombinase family protein [Brevundimonas intermedia]TFW11231.1 recombinase family protein [Brevundimonas intermedia]